MAKTAYDILGVAKGASEAEIKSAYRKLAKKHHPDVNPGDKQAQAKFGEIGTAYDLLSDKDKRAAYDRGEIDISGQPQQHKAYQDYANAQGRRYQAAGGAAGRPPNFDPSDLGDIFSSFFGQGAGAAQRPQQADTHYSIDIEFLEAALGASKRVTMPDGRTLDIAIPAGIVEGQQLRLKGQGAKSKAGAAGDAYVEIHIKPHPSFERHGNDIHIELPVGFHESVLGSKIAVPTIQGAVDMSIPKGASSGATLRLKGKGIKGADQLVRIKLVMPPAIDSDLEQAMRKWADKHGFNPRAAAKGGRK